MNNSIENIVTQLCDEMPAEHEFDRTKYLTERLHQEVRNVIPGALSGSTSRTKFGSLALAPRDALSTIKEYRTRAFMRGMLQAVEEVRRRFSGEKIRILYAGTGPAAPLILPILMRYTPEEVQIDAIDIHQRSISALKCFNEANGTQAYFSSYITGDAITYRHAGAPPHIIVSETMAAGLLVEPQVYITRNLAPQLIAGGIFVPEGVDVNISQFIPPMKFAAKELGRMHTFNASDFKESSGSARDVMSVQKSYALANPESYILGIQLNTKVRCFGEEVVLPGKSIITNPYHFEVEVPPGDVITNMDVSYALGSELVELALRDEVGELKSRVRIQV